MAEWNVTPVLDQKPHFGIKSSGSRWIVSALKTLAAPQREIS